MANCQSQNKKQVKPVKIVNSATNSTHYDAIGKLFAQYTQPKYRNLSTNIIRINIEVEYFCDNIIYNYCTRGGVLEDTI